MRCGSGNARAYAAFSLLAGRQLYGRYTRAVRIEIKLDIKAQPTDTTCGPTCLYSLYDYYGVKDTSLRKTISQIRSLDSGGTLAEILACHALKRGFQATIYTYHLQMFDPSWFADDGLAHNNDDLVARLDAQVKAKPWDKRLRPATRAIKKFLDMGGQLRMKVLTPGVIREHLSQGVPIVTGLSSTFLYGVPREHGPNDDSDDIKGEPQGHFVMIVGYDTVKRQVLVADPLDVNPPFHTAKYRLSVNRLINAVLLGILTYDANLLVIEPGPGMKPAKPPIVTEDEEEDDGAPLAPLRGPTGATPVAIKVRKRRVRALVAARVESTPMDDADSAAAKAVAKAAAKASKSAAKAGRAPGKSGARTSGTKSRARKARARRAKKIHTERTRSDA